jgi:hypothetical protein
MASCDPDPACPGQCRCICDGYLTGSSITTTFTTTTTLPLARQTPPPITIVPTAPPPTGGGGCPILKTFDGKEFVTIGKLNIHAPKNQDTIYTTSFIMKPVDGKYEIILDEAAYLFWDGSHIDSVKLTDESGNECKLISATHSRDGNVLSAISKSDDVRVRSLPGDRIKLVYDGCSGYTFTFNIEGYNMKTPLGITAILNWFRNIFGWK